MLWSGDKLNEREHLLIQSVPHLIWIRQSNCPIPMQKIPTQVRFTSIVWWWNTPVPTGAMAMLGSLTQRWAWIVTWKHSFNVDLNSRKLDLRFELITQDAKEAIKTLNNYEIRPGRFLVVTKSVDNRRLWVSFSSHLARVALFCDIFCQWVVTKFCCRWMGSPRTGREWRSEGRWRGWPRGCAISSSTLPRRTKLNLGGEHVGSYLNI